MDLSRYLRDPLHRDDRASKAGAPVKQFEESRVSETTASGNLWIIVAIAAIAIATLFSLCGSYDLPIVLVSIPAVIGVFLGIRYCLDQDPSWLLFALILEEVLPYLNIIPMDPESRWSIRYPLLLPIVIPAAYRATRDGLVWQGWFKYYSIFLGWCALTVLFSPVPAISAGRLLPTMLITAALILIASSVHSADDVQRLLGRFVLGCGILTVMSAIALVAFPKDLTWIEADGLTRFTGILMEPNDLGALTLATVPATLAHWPATHGWRRVLMVVVMVLSLCFGALADSRTVFGAIALGAIACAAWRYRLKGAAIALLVFAAVFITVNAFAPEYLNRDVQTMTGRTEVWNFEVGKLKEAPLTGFGYAVEGEIFQDRLFPLWDTFWDRGSNTPLHNGYLSLAISIGVPAALIWLILILRPWVWVFSSADDPWNLRPIFLLVVIPMFVLGTDESGVSESRGLKGLLFFLCWVLAERRRQVALESEQPADEKARATPLIAAISGCLLAATIIASPGDARATGYYVDSNAGLDSNSGKSESAPWKTLSAVNEFHFQPGDVVYLKRNGQWRETLKPHHGGNFRGVTFTGYGSGSAPTINGSEPITRWRHESGAVYSAPIAGPLYNVFVNQSPGWGLLHACCPSGARCGADSKSNPTEGHTCEIGPMRPGSWYWSGSGARGGTLYLWLADGGDPNSQMVEAVTREFGVHGFTPGGNNLDNLTLDGLRIIQTGQRAITLESGDAAGCCGSRGIGDGRGISGLVIRNSEVLRIGTGRFDDGSYGNAISIINATAPLVEHNVVSYSGNHGNGIQVHNANGARVIDNVVDHWNHNGIDIKGSHDVVVSSNLARDQTDIGAGFYTEYSRDVLFEHNRVERVSNGFQISEGASATIEQNNMESAGTGIYLGPKAIAAIVEGNFCQMTPVALTGDGSGLLKQGSNNWDHKEQKGRD